MINLGNKFRLRHPFRKVSDLKGCILLVILIFLVTSNLSYASAATEWDSALDNINALHNNYTSLQETIKNDSLKIQKLRKVNNDDLKSINLKLQSFDEPLLTRLKVEVTAIQNKHAPLLKQYSELGKQSTAAKKAKDLKTATILDLKRNKLKPAVVLARSEVKTKTEALAAARKLTATKTKPAKDALVTVTTLKKQIAVENKKVSAAQKARSEADKQYKIAVKQGDAILAAAEMRTSYEHMLQIHAMQQTLYSWEQKISVALRAAESKLP